MEEKYKLIKETKEFCFNQIKEANDTLAEIREKCDHPETELCTYSTRPGQYWEGTEICSICGEVVKWPYEGKDVVVWSGQGKLDDLTLDEINDEIANVKEDDLGWLANRNHG